MSLVLILLLFFRRATNSQNSTNDHTLTESNVYTTNNYDYEMNSTNQVALRHSENEIGSTMRENSLYSRDNVEDSRLSDGNQLSLTIRENSLYSKDIDRVSGLPTNEVEVGSTIRENSLYFDEQTAVLVANHTKSSTTRQQLHCSTDNEEDEVSTTLRENSLYVQDNVSLDNGFSEGDHDRAFDTSHDTNHGYHVETVTYDELKDCAAPYCDPVTESGYAEPLIVQPDHISGQEGVRNTSYCEDSDDHQSTSDSENGYAQATDVRPESSNNSPNSQNSSTMSTTGQDGQSPSEDGYAQALHARTEQLSDMYAKPHQVRHNFSSTDSNKEDGTFLEGGYAQALHVNIGVISEDHKQSGGEGKPGCARDSGHDDTADQNDKNITLNNEPHEISGAAIYHKECHMRSPDSIEDYADITPDETVSAEQEYDQINDLVSQQHAPVTGVNGHYDEIDYSEVKQPDKNRENTPPNPVTTDTSRSMYDTYDMIAEKASEAATDVISESQVSPDMTLYESVNDLSKATAPTPASHPTSIYGMNLYDDIEDVLRNDTSNPREPNCADISDNYSDIDIGHNKHPNKDNTETKCTANNEASVAAVVSTVPNTGNFEKDLLENLYAKPDKQRSRNNVSTHDVCEGRTDNVDDAQQLKLSSGTTSALQGGNKKPMIRKKPPVPPKKIV